MKFILNVDYEKNDVIYEEIECEGTTKWEDFVEEVQNETSFLKSQIRFFHSNDVSVFLFKFHLHYSKIFYVS